MDAVSINASYREVEENDSMDNSNSGRPTETRTYGDGYVYGNVYDREPLMANCYDPWSTDNISPLLESIRQERLGPSASPTNAVGTGDTNKEVDRRGGTGRAFDRHFIPSVIAPWSRAHPGIVADGSGPPLAPLPSTVRLGTEAAEHSQLGKRVRDQQWQDRTQMEQEDRRLQQMLLAQQRETRLKSELRTTVEGKISDTGRKLEDQDEEDEPDEQEWLERIYSINPQPKPANSVRRFQAPRTAMAAQQNHVFSAQRFQAPRNEILPQQSLALKHSPSISMAHQGLSSCMRDIEQTYSSVARVRKMVGLPTFSIDRGFENPPVTSSSTQGVRSADCVSRLEVHAVRPPLKSIRLLKLLSSTDVTNRNTTSTDVTPKYSAEDFPYVHYPEYIALSYVWGEENVTSTICVNGENVQVRTNLFQALSTIKESDPDAYLWADAICINQQDDKEKSNLVQHMGEIYANAKLVYAWLGPVEKASRDSSSDDLFTHLTDLGTLFWNQAGSKEAGKLNEHWLDFDLILTKNVDALFARFSQPPQQGGFPTEEYSKFSQRPYWSRIWVLQEVYYAKELHYICGNSRLPSGKLQGALILLETFQRYLLGSHGPVYEQLKSNSLLEKFTFGCPSFPEMHRLIIYTSIYPRDVITLRIAMTNFCVKELPRGLRATNPKDMIYGLMGFANNKEKSYIRADYSKSVEESYTIITRSMIRNGFTDILAWAQPETKGMAHLPSWVPDYTSTIYESLCSQGQAKTWLPQFRACGETRHHDENSQPFDDHVLSVHGRRLGEVLSVGRLWFPRWSGGVPSSSADAAEAPSTRSASYDELLSFLSEIRDLALHAGQIHDRSAATGQSDSRKAPHFTNSIWRVPCCDQNVINSRLVRRCPSAQSLYATTINSLHVCVRDSGKELPPESRPYVEALLRWVNKRPLLTANGFVGLGPASVEPGDTVAVLDGFNACYVLRSQQPSELNQYQLVGEAYVDGAMDGEMACSVPDTGEWFHLV